MRRTAKYLIFVLTNEVKKTFEEFGCL